MLAVHQRRSRPRTAVAIAAGVAAALAVPAAGQASAAPPLMPMAYGKYHFELPRSWPVINLSARPSTCVRFDRQVVYIGSPGANQACPARLIGATQAILIRRGPARSVRSAVQNPVARQITVTAPGISVTASYGTDPGQIDRILRSASLPEPRIKVPSAAAAGRLSRGRAARLPRRVTNYHGLGFDACTAPSAAYMSAWRSQSPYRAVGIYIGGSDRACAQPNLTASWLRGEAAAGWHFFPLYVGAQAALTVHHLGFDSGVYSSSLSGIEDLAKQYFTGTYAMPDVIDVFYQGTDGGLWQAADQPRLGWRQQRLQGMGAVGGAPAAVAETNGVIDVFWPGSGSSRLRHGRFTPRGGWRGPQRLGGRLASAPSPVEPLPGRVEVFWTGADRKLWLVTSNGGASWSRPASLRMGSLGGAAQATAAPGGAVDVVWRGAGNAHLFLASASPAGRWSHPLNLGGKVSLAPFPVAPAAGLLRVFWRGRDGRLWVIVLRLG